MADDEQIRRADPPGVSANNYEAFSDRFEEIPETRCHPLDEWRDPEGFRALVHGEITGPIPVTHVGTWPKRSRAVSVAAWTVAAMVVIVAGLAVAVLVLFLVAVVQALLDLIVH